ncbi:protein slx4 [Aspergillus ibericus CBS 121593]|uniref:Structure-specific endonuclease subunit SLX4 n=1 Tax=Aspergillus ibericus CBS 121593 TaxID=1448316 RepID=A0A395GYA8_9EURO|nr:structure-specific endonuclease subunit slx4 [Aspergillus ibericus CBS 121593]RAL00602.1 structure-specific endonuclease subunit slx4 [Aspergillus ibericus CBS 121593]
MATTAEVWVLSSSPEHNPVRTPAPPAYDPEKLFGLSPIDTSITPIQSPSELFELPTHSRYFEVGKQADEPRRKEVNKTPNPSTNDESVVLAIDGEAVADKPKRRGRPKKALAKAPEELEPIVASKKKTASKKSTTGVPKKRTETTTKRTTPANRTISGRVSKAGSSQPKEAKVQDNCPSTPRASSAPKETKEALDWERDGLQLEQAMTRRLDWTPTQHKAKSIIGLDDKPGSNDSGSGFGNLLSEYGFNRTATPASDYVTSEDGGPTKRRRIELVDPGIYPAVKQSAVDVNGKDNTGYGSQQSTLAAQKKPKKRVNKFTTLTARVTAKYMSESAETSDNVDEEIEAAEESLTTKSRSTKPKKKGQRSLKSREPEFVVLSPEEAAKTLEDQELIFGTCSQLEREDSPTTIRELQAAICQSELSMVSEDNSRPYQKLGKGTSSAVSRFTGSGNLWSVASRDVDGSLMQVEVVDLVDSPDRSGSVAICEQPSKDKADTAIECNDSRGSSIQRDAPEPEAALAVSEESTPLPTQNTQTANKTAENVASQVSASRTRMPNYRGFTDARLSKQVAKYGFKPIRGRKKMIELLQKCWESQHGTSSEPNDETIQQNSSADSVTEPASSQSKPSNKTTSKSTARKTNANTKGKPQSRTATKPTAEDATVVDTSKKSTSLPSSTSLGATTRPIAGQTPRKTPTYSFADVEEIEDSEDEAILSPSRLQGQLFQHTSAIPKPSLSTSHVPSTPTRLTSKNISTQTTATSTAAETPLPLPNLSNQITAAIRAQSQSTTAASTHKRSTPTWHEKILMYDPIPLEDFTTWLNTEGLSLINEDREVGAGSVRRWCESKGICCCYRPRKKEN